MVVLEMIHQSILKMPWCVTSDSVTIKRLSVWNNCNFKETLLFQWCCVYQQHKIDQYNLLPGLIFIRKIVYIYVCIWIYINSDCKWLLRYLESTWLTFWGQDKMVEILIWLKVHWNLFKGFLCQQAGTGSEKWLAEQATNDYLNQWWHSLLTHVCVTWLRSIDKYTAVCTFGITIKA